MHRVARLIVAIRDDLANYQTWKWHARHICGNPACCNPDHLTSGTREENMADRCAHGTVPVGERHGLTTHTDEQALEIEKAEGTQAEIAARFNSSASTVGRIKRHETRLHLWDVPGYGYETARCARHAAILNPLAASVSSAFCSALM